MTLLAGCQTANDCFKCEMELEVCKANDDSEMVLEDHDGCFKDGDGAGSRNKNNKSR